MNVNIFIAYVEEDRQYLEEFHPHLTNLERGTPGVGIWHEGDVQFGQLWDEAKRRELENADLIILLLSASFLAKGVEVNSDLKAALDLRKNRKTEIFPILVSSVDLQRQQIGQYQVFPRDGKAINLYKRAERQAIYTQISEELRKFIDALTFYKKGKACLETEEYTQALDHFREAIAIRKDYVHAYQGRAEAYLQLGRHTESIRDYDEATRLDPGLKLSVEKAIEQILVRIECTSESGIQWTTGFFIGLEGIILTTSDGIHSCLADESNLRGWYLGELFSLERLYVDENSTLVLLKIAEGQNVNPPLLPVLGWDKDIANPFFGKVVLGYALESQFPEEDQDLESRMIGEVAGGDPRQNIINVSVQSGNNVGKSLIGAPILDWASEKIIGIIKQVDADKKQIVGIIFSTEILSGLGEDYFKDNLEVLNVENRESKVSIPAEDRLQRTNRPLTIPDRSLMPEPLPLGIQNILQEDMPWSLQGPFVKAWIKNGPQGPDTVLVLGQGPPHIRELLENEAIAVLISTNNQLLHLINNGIIYLSGITQSERLQTSRNVLSLANELLSHHKKHMEGDSGNVGPLDGIKQFVSTLRKLELETGLVEVFEYPAAIEEQFEEKYTDFVSASQEQPIVVPPNPAMQISFVSLQTYILLDDIDLETFDVKNLEITLPSIWFKEEHFLELVNDLYRSQLGWFYADTTRRLSFWKERKEAWSFQWDWFNKKTDREKADLPEVKINVKLDAKFAIVIPIPTEKQPAAFFYSLLPLKIKDAKSKIAGYEQDLRNLEHKINNPDSSLRAVIISRMIDCALRDLPVSSNAQLNTKFEKWKNAIYPTVAKMWYKRLQELEVEPADLFSRHSFFITDLDEANESYVVRVGTVYDPAYSTLNLDINKKIPIVKDPSRYPEPDFHNDAGNNGQSVEFLNDLKGIIEQNTGVDSNRVKLQELLEDIQTRVDLETTFVRAYRFLNLNVWHSLRDLFEKMPQKHEVGAAYLGKAIYLANKNGKQAGEEFIQKLKAYYAGENVDLNLGPIDQLLARAVQYDKEFVGNYLSGIYSPDYLREYEGKNMAAYVVLMVKEGLRIIEKFEQAASSLNAIGETQNSAYVKLAEAFELAFRSKFFYFPDSPLIENIWRIVAQAPANQNFYGKEI